MCCPNTPLTTEAPELAAIVDLPPDDVVPPALRRAAAAVDAGHARRVVARVADLPVAVVAPERVHRVVEVEDGAAPREPGAEEALEALLGDDDVVRDGVLLPVARRVAGELPARFAPRAVGAGSM